MTNRLKMTQAIFGMPPDITPANVNSAAADPRFVLNGLYSKDGVLYRYTQFVDAVAYAAGQCVAYANATGTAVSNDRAGGSSVGTRCAGVVLATMTQDYYGFVQVTGVATLVTNGDDDIAAGDEIMLDTGTDGACDSYVGSAVVTATVNQTTVGAALDAREKIFGQALAADTDGADTVVATINCI